MRDPRETLARIRKQAAAATDGPWAVDPFIWKPGHPIPSSEWLGIEATGPVKGEVARIQPNGGEDDANAEFIAAARTTVPALLDLADAVLGLHRRSDHTRLVGSPRADREEHYCVEDQKPWPCPTFTAITTAPEGETNV